MQRTFDILVGALVSLFLVAVYAITCLWIKDKHDDDKRNK